eukprot:987334-Rhodomonas_salina.1
MGRIASGCLGTSHHLQDWSRYEVQLVRGTYCIEILHSLCTAHYAMHSSKKVICDQCGQPQQPFSEFSSLPRIAWSTHVWIREARAHARKCAKYARKALFAPLRESASTTSTTSATTRAALGPA